MAEEWRKIKEFGYDADTNVALFEVSDLGCVRNSNGDILPVHISSLGLRVVLLSTKTARTLRSVHILVANAFLEKPVGAKQLKRKDDNPDNNRLDNLYWSCEPVKRNGGVGNVGKAVRVYSVDKVLLGEFDSMSDAAKILSIHHSTISRCCHGVEETCFGLVWKFAANDDWFIAGMKPSCTLDELIKICSVRHSGTPRCSIRQYDLNGHIVSERKTAESWRSDGLETTCIIKCCLREQQFSNGYTYRYVVDDELFNLTETERIALFKQMSILSNKESYVRKYALDGVLVGEYKSITEASGNSRATAKRISSVCSRVDTFVTAAGYVWRYATDDDLYELSVENRASVIADLTSRRGKRIRQYTKDGVFVDEYKTSGVAARVVGGDCSAIAYCCKVGSNRTAYGFRWRWADADELRGS